MGAAEKLITISNHEVYEIEMNFDNHLYSCVSIDEVIDYEYSINDLRVFVDFFSDLSIKKIEILDSDYDELPEEVTRNLINKLEKTAKVYHERFNAPKTKEQYYHYLNA